MKTLRLSTELEKRLQRAAAVAGESLSEFIRRAATQRADALLNGATPEDFADVLGVVHGGGGRARRTGKAFTDILADHQRGG
ncbi:DUF1778 domain-containing protein [Mycobacterium sp.]|uniref:type II toxin -antitoxin system TacA 1-like antitoxin n=1 Tax=Mycobacterium sp. TaxID=1785 RepID=UPI003D6B1562